MLRSLVGSEMCIRDRVETPAGLRNYDSKITDGLTGINNRKSIIETIQEEFARAQAKNSPLSFILFQEFACAIAGEFYQVNAFNQPGVEEAKQLLRSSL